MEKYSLNLRRKASYKRIHGGGRGGSEGRGYVHDGNRFTLLAAETNTTLQSNLPQLKNKFKKGIIKFPPFFVEISLCQKVLFRM